MALRATLEELIEQVRAECRLSSNSSRGIDHREYIIQLIRRHYESLSENFEWEHLQLTRNSADSRKEIAAGQRLYDFPSAVNINRISKAWVQYAGGWSPIDYGIDYASYTALDPEADQRADPITAWGFEGRQQFEVWPLPATNHSASSPYYVAFEGQRAVERLTQNNSRADIDDQLIALYVAAEILAGNERKTEADVKLSAANSRMGTLRAGLTGKTRTTVGAGVIGGGVRRPREITHIRSSG